jgi:hypothetical protein
MMKKLASLHFIFLAFLCADGFGQEPAVITESRINVRGKPSLIGEVVTQLQEGDKVIVLEEIPTPNAKAGDPTNWAKIKLPANTPVWVFSAFVKEGKVTASRLNLRAGPGENYSILGRIEEGTPVKEIRTQDQWIEIQAPETAYAFIDASLMRRTGPEQTAPPLSANPAAPAKTKAPPAVESPETAEVKPAPKIQELARTTNEPPAIVAIPRPTQPEPGPAEQPHPAADALASSTIPQNPPAIAPQVPATAPQVQDVEPAKSLESTNAPAEIAVAPANQVTNAATPAIPAVLPPIAEAPAPKPQEPLPRRIVRREGIVRPTKSIQAPTWYELVHPDTKMVMNYLHEEKLGVDLKDWKNQKVVVSGEEGLDSRWPDVPILELETIESAP